MKRKQKFVCEKCGRICVSAGGLTLHKNKQHPYVPPPAPPRTHRNYAEIADSMNWGQDMSAGEAKHPSIDLLTVGTLYLILKELRKITAHYKNI